MVSTKNLVRLQDTEIRRKQFTKFNQNKPKNKTGSMSSALRNSWSDDCVRYWCANDVGVCCMVTLSYTFKTITTFTERDKKKGERYTNIRLSKGSTCFFFQLFSNPRLIRPLAGFGLVSNRCFIVCRRNISILIKLYRYKLLTIFRKSKYIICSYVHSIGRAFFFSWWTETSALRRTVAAAALWKPFICVVTGLILNLSLYHNWTTMHIT